MSDIVVQQSQKMVVGLGNPGVKYRNNRHNIGFQCLEIFAERHGIDLSKSQQRALVGIGWVQLSGVRQKVVLVKPLTYMNASGTSVAPLARYYQIDPCEMLVIHDDIDLESGKIRLRANGGSGGQNGIKSLINQLGNQNFHRARIGVGRPPGRMDPAAYVLQNFSAEEEEVFGTVRTTVVDAAECWLAHGLDTAMNRYNS